MAGQEPIPTAASTPEQDAPPTPGVVRSPRRPSPRVAQWKRTWYFLRRNNLALFGIAVLIIIAGIAIYALFTPIPWTGLVQECSSQGTYPAPAGCVCTYSAGTTDPGPGCYQTPVSSSGTYPSVIPPTLFNPASHGTAGPLPIGSLTVNPNNPFFYNMWNGLLRGSDWSLGISVGIVITGALLGLLVGAISGYYGGWVDEGLMRIVDIFLSIPQLLFVIIVVAVLVQIPTFQGFTTRIELLILGFVIVWWPFYARIVRSQVLVVREQKYIEAARASGANNTRIVIRHVVPNSVYPVFIQMSLDVGTIPLLLGTLVYLNVPIFPTPYFPEWGAMTALSVTGNTLIDSFLTCQFGACIIPWWQFLFPGLALFMYAISVNFLADGLRDALDPRLRR
jgi:peptide/nickel transport system permease protein